MIKPKVLVKEATHFQELLARLADEHHRELTEVRNEITAKNRSRQSALRAENRDLRRQLEIQQGDNDDLPTAPEDDAEKVQSLLPYGKVLEPSQAMRTPEASPRDHSVSSQASKILVSPHFEMIEQQDDGTMLTISQELMPEGSSAAVRKSPPRRLSGALLAKGLNAKDGEGVILEERDSEEDEKQAPASSSTKPQVKTTTISEDVEFEGHSRPSYELREVGYSFSCSSSCVRNEETWTVHEIWLTEDLKTPIADASFKRKVAKSTKEIKRGGTVDSDSSTKKRGCVECMTPLIASPSNPFRLGWDILGMMLISYDVIMIPMGLFKPPQTTFLDVMNHITMFFWTGDIIASFFVGFVYKGVTIMDPKHIAQRYARTWMVPDVIVVTADWANYMASLGEEGGDDVGGVGRFLRVLRTIRTLRLVRLLKLKRIMAVIEDHIESEYMSIVGEILKLLVCMLVLSHIVACLFYLIGDSAEDEINWVEINQINGTSWEYRYTTSLHWSLTQLMLESMDVSPTCLKERCFTVLTLVFGLIVFSSVVSRVTSSMIQLQNMHDNTSKQFWLLRRYFRERSVPKTLAARIQRYLEYTIQQAQQHIQETNVKILSLLSNQLHDELQYAISVPHLGCHPFFAHISKVSDVVMYRLSSAAISRRSLACDDSLFFQGEVASSMFFVVAGELTYIKESLPDIVAVRQEDWICEPALWTTWNHLGDLHASTECDLIVLASKTFGEVMRSNPLIWQLASTYAKAFVRKLNGTPRDDMVDVARFTVESEKQMSTRKSIAHSLGIASTSTERDTTNDARPSKWWPTRASEDSSIGHRNSSDLSNPVDFFNVPSMAVKRKRRQQKSS